MKILKIFGVVVGIHVFALILIFANPGCSSGTRSAPSPSETVIKGDVDANTAAASDSPISAAPPSFDPNATAGGSPVVRFSPTRPGTPAAAVIEAQPVSDVTPATTYTVASGDSLWTIAKKHRITVAEIATANNIRSSATVRIGQKLIIPSKAVASSSVSVADQSAAKAATPDQPAAARGNGDTVKHTVRPGETLGAIARKYQVKVGEIATANNITDPAKIRPGMELSIPGWKAPAGSGTRNATTATPAPTRTPVEASPVSSVPTLVIPPPGQDLDAGLRQNSSEPPVIQVEDSTK